MNILLIAPDFFGYSEAIAAELRRRGANVDVLADRPFKSAFMKGVSRFATTSVSAGLVPYYRRRLKEFGRSAYELIVVVNGQTVSPVFFSELRRSFGSAWFVLYMWDSLSNRSTVKASFRYFDECWSFDPLSVRDYGLKFRPLFFVPKMAPICGDAFRYDVSFIGTIHSDRYRVISEIRAQIPSHFRGYFYMYIQAKWVYYWYRCFSRQLAGARRAEFSFQPLSGEVVKDVFRSSKNIIDVEHPNQTGLTMRTIETIGARKRLITTNHGIVEYEFYDPRNICVVDRVRPLVSREFLDGDYVAISPSVYRRYSIAGWVDEVTGQRVLDPDAVS